MKLPENFMVSPAPMPIISRIHSQALGRRVRAHKTVGQGSEAATNLCEFTVRCGW